MGIVVLLYAATICSTYLNLIQFLQIDSWLHYTHIGILIFTFTRIIYRITSIYAIIRYADWVEFGASLFDLIIQLEVDRLTKWLKENYSRLAIVRTSARFTWNFKSEVHKTEKLLNNMGEKMRETCRYMKQSRLNDRQACERELKQIVENEKSRMYYSDIKEQLKDNLELVMDENWQGFKTQLKTVFEVTDNIQERRYALENEILYFKEKVLYSFKHQIFISGDL